MALEDARQGLRLMQKSMSDARSWLSQIEAFHGRLEGMSGQQRGDVIHSFAGACEAAAQAGLRVNLRISGRCPA